MKIVDFITRMKSFHSTLLTFVESDDNFPENFQEFITFINSNGYGENPDELRSMLHIIYKIFSHHKRSPILISKIQKLLLHFSEKIKQTFSNSDLFRIFKNNKLILSFLFEHKIITVDENIAVHLFEKYDQIGCNFFYPEIEPFLEKVKVLKNSKVTEPDFLKIRQEGENDSRICQLIRQDSLDEFICFIKEKKLKYSSSIPKSFLETHSFLIRNESLSIIEYAAFFGSIQIVKFLLQKDMELPSSLWLCAIHSKNIELIHLLEKNQIQPEYESYETCFIESLKCHHNDIAHYIQTTYMSENESIKNNDYFYKYSNYYNFEFFPNDLIDDYDSIFEIACQQDYSIIVKILLENDNINLNELLLRKAVIYYYFRNKI